MFKRILVVLAASVVLVGVAAAPAVASQSECGTGRYCVWTNSGWSGPPNYYWTIGSGTGGFCVNYGGSLNDNVDSNYITGGRSVTQYRDANCSGTAISFNQPQNYGGPAASRCTHTAGWSCNWEGAGSWLPSSAWIIR